MRLFEGSHDAGCKPWDLFIRLLYVPDAMYLRAAKMTKHPIVLGQMSKKSFIMENLTCINNKEHNCYS